MVNGVNLDKVFRRESINFLIDEHTNGPPVAERSLHCPSQAVTVARMSGGHLLLQTGSDIGEPLRVRHQLPALGR